MCVHHHHVAVVVSCVLFRSRAQKPDRGTMNASKLDDSEKNSNLSKLLCVPSFFNRRGCVKYNTSTSINRSFHASREKPPGVLFDVGETQPNYVLKFGWSGGGPRVVVATHTARHLQEVHKNLDVAPTTMAALSFYPTTTTTTHQTAPHARSTHDGQLASNNRIIILACVPVSAAWG